jgi:formate-dependent nitrite reductase membrane component NrfD
MKHNVMLTVASLLSILFMTFHLTRQRLIWDKP